MLVAKYKFDKSIYENLIPVFNDGYEGYTITDEIDSENENYVIRTIECDVLPTYMRFGVATSDAPTNRELSLLEVIELNTTELTSCSRMFIACQNVTSINTKGWTLNKVTNMQDMFYYCAELTSLDVSNFDTSKVTNMSNMFYNCQSLTSLDLSNWNVTNNTLVQSIFHSCTKLHTLDLSNWTLTDDDPYIFYNCSSLAYIKCNSIDVINSILDNNKESNFPNRTGKSIGKIITTSSTNVDTTTLSSRNWSIDTSSGTKLAEYKYDKSIWNSLVPEFNEGYSGYFVSDRIEDEVNSPNVATRELVGYGGLPTKIRFNTDTEYIEKALISVDYMNTDNLTSMKKMFKQCSNLISVNTEGWNTSNVTDMRDMFADCNNLTSLDLSNFDTSNVTDMRDMFYECKSLTSLDLSNWNTSEVSTMESMFYNCRKLTSLDVSNWNTSNVTTMRSIFNTCRNLTSLDVSNWNTSKVTDMKSMFCYCSDLISLDVSNFDTSEVTNMNKMFYKCSDLISLDISNFDISNVTDMEEMFSSTSDLSDIGMLYCSPSTINTISSALPTTHTQTIWVQDTKASDYTATDYVTIKDYKEDNRTLYLNSPLLEGDEIVNKEGKLYHYHKMGSVVLNGSEMWTSWNNDTNPSGYSSYYIYYNTSGSGHTLNIPIGTNTEVVCNTLKPNNASGYGSSSEGVRSLNGYITFTLEHEKLRISDDTSFNDRLAVWKSWLSKNPTTVIYELRNPYYELISDDPLIVQSYAEGKLDTSSIISPTSIQSVPYEEELTYLYTSTQYCIQFYSTANCTVDITLGGTKIENKSVLVGLNKIYITTPSTLVDNKLIINAKGNATISEVVVVNSNAEFDYFDGLKSSFEDCLVTDVDSENYGKYKVGVKMVGKNKWTFGETEAGVRFISNSNKTLIPKGQYTITDKCTALYDNVPNMILKDRDEKIYRVYLGNNGVYTFNFKNDIIRIELYSNGYNYANSIDKLLKFEGIQIEEGTTATSYEPYKETNATIYLNSPLLKEDRIEVVDGIVAHVKKRDKTILDGNETWWIRTEYSNDNILVFNTDKSNWKEVFGMWLYCDKFLSRYNVTAKNFEFITYDGWGLYIGINKSKLSTPDVDGLKQWLQQNPTTVVYELAEPYYEDITPLQSSFVISTVSEGDMEILTDLPIKSNITYLTNIASAVLMEQQLDELDNGTESLTNILEDKINE